MRGGAAGGTSTHEATRAAAHRPAQRPAQRPKQRTARRSCYLRAVVPPVTPVSKAPAVKIVSVGGGIHAASSRRYRGVRGCVVSGQGVLLASFAYGPWVLGRSLGRAGPGSRRARDYEPPPCADTAPRKLGVGRCMRLPHAVQYRVGTWPGGSRREPLRGGCLRLEPQEGVVPSCSGGAWRPYRRWRSSHSHPHSHSHPRPHSLGRAVPLRAEGLRRGPR